MQKFKRFDHVQITENLGSHMRHQAAGVEAIVIGSYADQFGGSQHDQYTLYLKDQGRVSWYYESQLTLIEHNRQDIMDSWEAERQGREDRESSHTWIFSHPQESLRSGYSITKLAKDLGINDMWPSGEGVEWDRNFHGTREVARNFVLRRDIQKWLDFCATNPLNLKSKK